VPQVRILPGAPSKLKARMQPLQNLYTAGKNSYQKIKQMLDLTNRLIKHLLYSTSQWEFKGFY
jgi:hypothetical protein